MIQYQSVTDGQTDGFAITVSSYKKSCKQNVLTYIGVVSYLGNRHVFKSG